MNVNKVLLLNEVALLNSIQESGYEDIVIILSNRNIDGQKLLKLTELEIISWKLAPSQKKNLFTFIKQLKDDPYIIIKREARKPVFTNPKPNLPFNTKPTIAPRQIPEPKKSINANQNEFKRTLGATIAKESDTKQIYPKLLKTRTSTSKLPLPEPEPEKVKPLHFEKFTKNVPDEPLNSKPKPKPFLPAPLPSRNINKNNLQKNMKPDRRSPSPDCVYEDVDNIKESRDYGYLSPNEIDYIDSLAQKIKNDKNNQDSHKVNENDVDNTYEPPPTIKKQTKLSRKPNETRAESVARGKDITEKSWIENRAPIPIPTDSNEESDGEINNYEPVPNSKLSNLRNNLNNIKLSTASESNQKEGTVPEISCKRNKIEDLENIIIVTEDQSSRSSKFFGSLGRFFSKSKINSTNENYENHMLKNEKPSLEISDEKLLQNRPLPEIPCFPPTSTSSLRKQREHIRNKLPNIIIDRRSHSIDHEEISDSNLKIDFAMSKKNSNEQVFRSNRNSSESFKDKEKGSDEDLPDYENHQSLSSSSYSSQRNSTSLKLAFSDELALKLSEELKAREKLLKQRNFEPNKPSKVMVKATPASETEDDDNGLVYGNIDNLIPIDRCKWKNSKVNIQNEDLDESEQPFYGNVEESDIDDENNHEIDNGEFEENAEEDEEEPEEYIDSIFNINNEKFYRNTDRKGAKLLLQNLPDRAFLFRPSRKYFLVLTIKHKHKFYNLGIERTDTNKIRLNADMRSVSPEFGTLRAFVDYFQKEELTFMDGEKLIEIFLNPALPADLF